jgi:trimethylamine:corrinoid methyltransferase-like protein
MTEQIYGGPEMQAYTAQREREFAERQAAESMVGMMVTFNDCVGYVDSVEKAINGYAANVVALRRRPGLWKTHGNPSIDAQCYRVPVSHLTKVATPPTDEQIAEHTTDVLMRLDHCEENMRTDLKRRTLQMLSENREGSTVFVVREVIRRIFGVKP